MIDPQLLLGVASGGIDVAPSGSTVLNTRVSGGNYEFYTTAAYAGMEAAFVWL